MKNRVIIGSALMSALLLAAPAQAWAAETYSIDPVHTNVHFRVKHLSASIFQGRFNDISGQVVFDADDPSGSSIDIRIKAESIDARNDRLNGHIKSPDFLNAKQFPNLTFKSTSVRKTGERTYQISGQLSIRGVTKDLTVEAEHIGSSEFGRMGKRIGFSTSFTINRRDFNVNYGNDAQVGDELTIILDLEGVQR